LNLLNLYFCAAHKTWDPQLQFYGDVSAVPAVCDCKFFKQMQFFVSFREICEYAITGSFRFFCCVYCFVMVLLPMQELPQK